jgi:lysophospholipase L1-like esterase
MTLTRKAIVLLAVLLAGLFIWRQFFYWPVTNKHPTGTNIIAFGDSLTYGTGAAAGQDYPSQLSKLSGREIINKGVPGETTAQALNRLDKDVLQQDPRVVILLIGGNDFLQRLPMSQAFQNIDTMVQRIQESGALVVLVGMNSFIPFMDSFGPEFKKIAKTRGALYVPNALKGIIDSPKLKGDQVHPNGEGYKLIADRIYAVVKPYL